MWWAGSLGCFGGLLINARAISLLLVGVISRL